MKSRIVLMSALVAAACAGAMLEGPPPARPGEPVAAWKRDTEDREATVLYARNDTNFVVVATFRLFDCVNIQHACGDLQPRTLEPGVIVVVDTLRPVDVQKDHSFNFSFTARPQ